VAKIVEVISGAMDWEVGKGTQIDKGKEGKEFFDSATSLFLIVY